MSSPTNSPTAHKPYIPDEQIIPEFTWSAVLVGAVLGIVFGASSLYLVLKVGMTVSASIPVAVMAITLFRVFSKMFGVRRATILENNIVQTTGSAGESVAFGVGVSMPAVMILGFDMDISRVMVVSVLGGILGILMMIPLRRAFIVKQHGTLKYPEGTACADVLIVGETGGATAKTVFIGFGLAFVYKFLMGGLKLWKDVVSRPLDWFRGATPAIDVDPALLGVGYIIGTRIACIMVAGGILSYFVFVPAIHFFGDALQEKVFPGTELIKTMNADEVRKAYVLYIGAGAVAMGGIISLCKALPLIVSSVTSGLRDMRATMTAGDGRSVLRRTERDMPMSVVFFGSLALVAVIALFLGLAPETHGAKGLGAIFNLTNLIAAVLIVLFGFLFVTVSSRLTGEIGSSSNPISGMTIATLLLTCLIFLLAGWTSMTDRLVALSIAAVVCIAASNGGTTSQDLKTGYLVGATPKFQQWSILVGAVSSALVIGVILIVLNQSSTVYTQKRLPTLKEPLQVSQFTRRETCPVDHRPYYVWQAVEGNAEGVPQGKYLIDGQGRIRWLVDPGINGARTRRDNGVEVQKFNPPQARLFATITDGILQRKLPWSLVLLGVFSALVVELCGMPSLPFAVGMYLPLSSSTPIFVGGLVRYLAERRSAKSAENAQPDESSDMSPGVLLSTGYIAGGTITGVVIAFFCFSDRLTQTLSFWQYRTVPAPAEKTFDGQCRVLAEQETGQSAAEPQIQRTTIAVKELNEALLPRYVRVPRGTTLRLPEDKTYAVRADTRLGALAQELLGDEKEAASLFDLNEKQLQKPPALPPDAALRLPQRNTPALAMFGLLAVFLIAVGRGWILK